VLSVIEDEGLQEHAAAVGTHTRELLHAVQERHQGIGDIRGRGECCVGPTYAAFIILAH
jgi:4-aminobutyrate aminotransferase-like enzyme